MIKYWIWLSLCLDNASAHLIPLLEKFNSPKEIYKTPIKTLKDSYLLSANELKKMNNKNLDRVFKIIDECNESKIDIITFDSELYPKNLKSISNPPACLYLKGKLKDVNNLPIICIIGSRKISNYGKLVAWSLSGRLTYGGITVLSGGAIGGDSEAHQGALAVGGKTIAVVPCGLNFDYLKTNDFLRKLICDNGCLISEFPPSTPLYKNAFQLRNRILSGMSLGVVVVEAPKKSGTLITVRHALEQNRDVFVVTGKPDDPNYAGSHELLKDGAKPIFDADDIFCEYESDYPHIIDPNKAKSVNLSKLYRSLHTPKILNYDTDNYDELCINPIEDKKTRKEIDKTLPKNVQIVYNCIDSDIFTVEDLVDCNISFEEILSSLTQLEMFGYIKAIPGGRYSIIY